MATRRQFYCSVRGIFFLFCWVTLVPCVLTESSSSISSSTTDDTVSCHYTYQALGGTITSPNYPESYGSNAYCRYDITVPDNVNVGLTVNSFDTEQDMDNLYIYDSYSGSQLDSLSGTLNTPFDIKKKVASIYLIFASDGTTQSTGWNITWFPDCGTNISSSELVGSFTSPNQPNNYYDGLHCIWHIEAPADKSVKIRFTQFALEEDANCTYDYLAAYDGAEEDPDMLLGSLHCGSVLPDNIISTSDTMTVVFHSDGSEAASGFIAVHTHTDPPTTTSTTSTTTTPATTPTALPPVEGKSQSKWLRKQTCNISGMNDTDSHKGLFDHAVGNRFYPEIHIIPSGVTCTNQRAAYYVEWNERIDRARVISRGLTTVSASSVTGSSTPDLVFDGKSDTYFVSETETDPWITGDLGMQYRIVGAAFTNNADNPERTQNVHFLVARTEADLSDYSSSVCHEYPGPAMATSQVEWLPCYPIRRARFFKITTSTATAGYFNFAQLEVYGFKMQLD